MPLLHILIAVGGSLALVGLGVFQLYVPNEVGEITFFYIIKNNE